MQTLCVPVSIGELIDKITILEIKLERIVDEAKKKRVLHEYNLLMEVVFVQSLHIDQNPLLELMNELRFANTQIWDAENILRQCELNAVYDKTFQQAARTAFTFNTVRHGIKQRINTLFDSNITEEKQYG